MLYKDGPSHIVPQNLPKPTLAIDTSHNKQGPPINYQNHSHAGAWVVRGKHIFQIPSAREVFH